MTTEVKTLVYPKENTDAKSLLAFMSEYCRDLRVRQSEDIVSEVCVKGRQPWCMQRSHPYSTLYMIAALQRFLTCQRVIVTNHWVTAIIMTRGEVSERDLPLGRAG